MLGKLLKYDLKANRNMFLLMHGILLAVALGSRFSMLEAFEALQGYSGLGWVTVLLMITYFIALVAINVMAYVLIIRRFYINLFGSEGYLSFTLPVTAIQHFASKVISALIWLLSTVVIQVISLLITFSGVVEQGFFGDFCETMGEVISQLFSAGDTIWQVVIGVFNSLAGLYMIYFAICLGQMVNRHRVLSSVLFYLGMNFFLNLLNGFLKEIFISVDIAALNGVVSYGTGYYIITVLLLIIKLALFGAGSVLIMQKKLNLE